MTTQPDPWDAPYPREALAAADRAVGASFGRGDSSLAIACRALEAAAPLIRADERERCAQLAERHAAVAEHQAASDTGLVPAAVLRLFAAALRESPATTEGTTQ